MGLREIADILRCPLCNEALEAHLDENVMDCPRCQLRYTVKGEILNLVPSQALALEKK